MDKPATALDAPASVLDEEERGFVGQIREHGWFNTRVFGEQDRSDFNFTTGFWVNHGLPEVILFALSKEAAHTILWDIYRHVAAGGDLAIHEPTTQFTTLPVAFIPVAKNQYADHLGWSRWFYGSDEFPCLQMVWSDRNGVLPWQPGFDERFLETQPDLSAGGWGLV